MKEEIDTERAYSNKETAEKLRRIADAIVGPVIPDPYQRSPRDGPACDALFEIELEPSGEKGEGRDRVALGPSPVERGSNAAGKLHDTLTT